MEKLKAQDILICRRNSTLSKLIKKVTKSEWSHTASVLNIWGKTYILDMQSKGVELLPYQEWVNKWNYEFIIYRTQDKEYSETFHKRALSVVSKRTKYDYFTFIFRIPFKIITNKIRYRTYEVETKRMICSQLTGWLHNIIDWKNSTPDDIYNYLKNDNKYFQVISNFENKID